MINITEKIIIKVTEQQLRLQLEAAIKNTSKAILNNHGFTKSVKPEQISSSSGLACLSFLKYFNSKTAYSVTDIEGFLNNCYILAIGDHKEKGKTKPLEKYFENFRLPATMIKPFVQGLKLMFLILWTADAVLLTFKFKLTLTEKYRGTLNGKIILGEKHLTEVFSFFYSFRMPIDRRKRGGYNLKCHKELTPSLQNRIQSYAWRYLVCTDWHSFSRINLEDIEKFLTAKRNGDLEHITAYPPFTQMLLLCASKSPHIEKIHQQLTSSIEDYRARNKDFLLVRPKKQEVDETLEDAMSYLDKFTLGDFQPHNASKMGMMNEQVLKALKEKPELKKWLEFETEYIYLLERKHETSKACKNALSYLNRFLFLEIPEKTGRISDIPTISEFNRRFIHGRKHAPSLIRFLKQGIASTTLAGYLSRIDLFFNYLEKSTKKDIHCNFTNPIIRKTDFPIINRPSQTTKTIIRERHAIVLLNYLHSIFHILLQFNNKILNGDMDIMDILKNTPESKKDFVENRDLISTSLLGSIPHITIDNNDFAITHISKTLLHPTFKKIKDDASTRARNLYLPNFSLLAPNIVMFETALRKTHTRWLDRNTYDERIDRKCSVSDLCELHVPTDKIRGAPWHPLVSKRVIQVLDECAKMIDIMDEPWKKKSYPYQNRAHTKYKAISPIFPKGGSSESGGTPFCESAADQYFRMVLFSFQNFCNENNVFQEKLDLVSVENHPDKGITFHSDVSPHSARATMVSIYSKVLPLDFIGKYISGHRSEACTSYYVKTDEDYIKQIADYNEKLKKRNKIKEVLSRQNLNGDIDILKSQVLKNPASALANAHAHSFDGSSDGEGELNGLIIARSSDPINFAYNSTHICIFRNICPKIIRDAFGEMQCGRCWASVKTIYHAPAICALVRKLYSELDDLNERIKRTLDAKGDIHDIDKIEFERNRIAQEIAAWSMSHNLLESSRSQLHATDKFYTSNPELLKLQLKKIDQKNPGVSELLLRIMDVNDFPHLFDHALEMKAKILCKKILIASQGERMAKRITENDLSISNFFGIVRSAQLLSGEGFETFISKITSKQSRSVTSLPLLTQ